MKQYEMMELEYQAPAPAGSAVDVDLTATFTSSDGHSQTVSGFYAGNGEYRVRFYPRFAGQYHYQVSGVVTDTGDLVCQPADETATGIIRAAGTHFKTESGHWFYPFGTTVYALAHQSEAVIEETFRSLTAAPFNKVRLCIFPKWYEFNHRESRWLPFKKDGDQFNVDQPVWAYWDNLDRVIARLNQLGIQADLILFHPYDHWGLAKLNTKQCLTYLNYVIRRFSAYPNIWWSLANEYDLLPFKKEQWLAIADYLHQNDPYHHLLSNHHMVIPWDFNNPATTHICVQIKNVDYVSRTIRKFQKPMMVDECRYEGNINDEWGNISAFEMVNRFWKVITQGAYCTHGETYLSPDNILWWAAGGKLKGESPARIAFLKKIVESLPGPLEFAGNDMNEEKYNQLKARAAKHPADFPGFAHYMLAKLDWQQAESLMNSNREFIGKCPNNSAFLYYYDRHCTARPTINLPTDGKYQIEVIDSWQMTKKMVVAGVNGQITVSLPGKEGMAILARRIE